jgi:hypothetical protein
VTGMAAYIGQPRLQGAGPNQYAVPIAFDDLRSGHADAVK